MPIKALISDFLTAWLSSMTVKGNVSPVDVIVALENEKH